MVKVARDYQNNDIFGHPQWNNNNNNEEEQRPQAGASSPVDRPQPRPSRPSFSFEAPTMSDMMGTPPRPQNPHTGEQAKKKRVYDEAMQELNALDGMGNVKGKIEETLALATTFKQREKYGLNNTLHALHMVFTGNAGTGKTTVARIVGQLFYGAGLLEKGNYKRTETDRERVYGMGGSSDRKVGDVPFVECSNADISSAFWGEDEKNMKKKLDDANGGVLFMDEAYSMISRSGHRSGEKVMAVLVQEMENRRNSVCVICAGYPKEMEEFMQYNTGLASRFATVIHFENYDVPALIKIAEGMVKDRDYRMSEGYAVKLAERLEKERLHPHFGNARTVRNIIEESIRIHAKRVFDLYGTNPSREQLIMLEEADIRPFSPIFTGEEIDDPFDKWYKDAVKAGIVSGDKSKLPPKVRNQTPRQ
jgi:stage V sporulation protein K